MSYESITANLPAEYSKDRFFEDAGLVAGYPETIENYEPNTVIFTVEEHQKSGGTWEKMLSERGFNVKSVDLAIGLDKDSVPLAPANGVLPELAFYKIDFTETKTVPNPVSLVDLGKQAVGKTLFSYFSQTRQQADKIRADNAAHDYDAGIS